MRIRPNSIFPGYLPLAGRKATPPRFGANPNDSEEALAWEQAVNYKEMSKLKALIGSPRVNVNFRNRQGGETALIRAVRLNEHELVEMLLKAGADVNIRNDRGETAVFEAIRYSDRRMVQMLMAKDASLNVSSTYGETPLQWVARKNQWQLYESFLAGKGNVDWCAFGHHAPLSCAAEAGHFKMVDLLLKDGAKVDHTNSRNFTALHLAADGGYPAVVKRLLEAGANINGRTDRKETPLMLAAGKNMGQTVHLLLSRGPDINLKDQNGFTALSYAVRNADPQVLDRLLAHPALDCKDMPAINEAFLTAIAYNNVPAFYRLLALNADLEYCRSRSLYTPLMNAVSLTNSGVIIDELLRRGANVNALDHNGVSVLHYCLMRQAGNGPEQSQIALTLLDHGANPDQKTKNGQTPIFRAIYQGLTDVIPALIEKGADVNIADGDGMTPLHAAAFMGRTDLLEMLLSRGANPNVKNRYGVTPMSWIQAIGRMYVEYDDLFSSTYKDVDGCVRLLKQYGAQDSQEALEKAFAIEESKYFDSYIEGW